jgi:5-formyltetrahydrofolate cyclo-ligase
MRSEIDPGPLGARLAQAGIEILLPAVTARGAALEFREAQGARSPDILGLPAPPATAPVVEPDLVIVPLLAFDAEGYRLGYGGGYYDRTLASLRARRPVLAVGLAFAGQEMAALPHAAHDQKLDALLTEIGYRRFRA